MESRKQAPHSIDAEQAVIGAVLLSPASWDQVSFLRPDDFYLSDHKAIWQHLQTDESSRELVSLLSSCRTVDQRVYIGELARNTPSAANCKAYASIVRDRAVLRRLAAECADILAGITNDCRPADVIASASRRIEAVGEQATIGNGPRHIHDITADWYADLTDRMSGKAIAGIPTGFKAIDERWGGLRPGQVIVIAGRPKTGKTTLAVNIAEHVARTKPVAIFQMEMAEMEMADRAVSSTGSVYIKRLREGTVSEDDLHRVVSAIHVLKQSKLFIDATPRQTIDYIRVQSRKFVKENGAGLLLIDYLGLIRTDSKFRSKNDEIGELSRDIKLLAKETGCPVILLCQMNRAVEKEKRKPMLADLRDSGAIEQDADVICFTHKDDPEQNYSEIITRAMRSGEPGTDYLLCDFGMSRFTEPYSGWVPPQPERDKPLARGKRTLG